MKTLYMFLPQLIMIYQNGKIFNLKDTQGPLYDISFTVYCNLLNDIGPTCEDEI